jgi:hypothetical protein
MLLSLSLQHTRQSVDRLVEGGPELVILSVCHHGLGTVDVEDHLGLIRVIFFRVYHFGRRDSGIVSAQFLDLLFGATEQSI